MNAKEELRKVLQGREILCAYIENIRSLEIPEVIARLSVGYIPSQYTQFMEALDFDYDAGYGRQEVFGLIWIADGTWYTRGEYDGSEWWEHHSCPKIPENMA